LGEQSAHTVDQPGGLGSQIIIESDEHLEFGQGLFVGSDASQGVGHGAGGVGDDEGVAGVGLGVAGVEVGDAPHGQAGKVGHIDAHGAGHGQG